MRTEGSIIMGTSRKQWSSSGEMVRSSTSGGSREGVSDAGEQICGGSRGLLSVLHLPVCGGRSQAASPVHTAPSVQTSPPRTRQRGTQTGRAVRRRSACLCTWASRGQLVSWPATASTLAWSDALTGWWTWYRRPERWASVRGGAGEWRARALITWASAGPTRSRGVALPLAPSRVLDCGVRWSGYRVRVEDGRRPGVDVAADPEAASGGRLDTIWASICTRRVAGCTKAS